MKLFGYASLLSADAINAHKLGPESENIHESDLQEAVLHNYARAWEAEDKSGRYLGITRKVGAMVNGILFDLPENERERFLKVEGFPNLYRLEEVSKHIDPPQEEKVYALVTQRPTDKGKIHEGYKKEVAQALKHRSKEFQAEFHATTPDPE